MSSRALGQQFDMRPNIKSTPGSQGTLFHAPATRNWPRHYTPERQDDVMRALHQKRTNTAGSFRWSPPGGLKLSAESPGVGAETRFAIDTVARSTVPVEDLEGLHPRYGISAGQRLTGPEHGHYSPHGVGGTKADPKLPHIALAEGHARGRTPIHEIGHHVSAVHDVTTHSAYDTPARRGAEEGYAENYADQHARDVRGRPIPSEHGARDWATYEADIPSENRFTDAFIDARKRSPLQPTQFDPNSRQARGLPKEHVEGQLPLIDKVRTAGRGIGAPDVLHMQLNQDAVRR